MRRQELTPQSLTRREVRNVGPEGFSSTLFLTSDSANFLTSEWWISFACGLASSAEGPKGMRSFSLKAIHQSK
jgi:hypothetical protein